MFKFFLALIFLSIFSILRCSSSTQNTTVSDEEKNEKWMDQCLDHYSSDPRMWEMRYFENFEYYEQGGPIFILVGGEWEASHSFLESGHIHDMAKKFNATMFNTEHRYYGKSHPRNDTSRENLKWLTVEQALGDLFNFIRHIKRIHPELSEAKVIMFGVSYSGSLVTWFRQKHENVVDGVWSSSAPVYPDLKFVEGKKIVEDAIKQIGGRECLDRIHNAFVELQRLIKNGDNEKIEKDFPLCASLNTTDPREVWSFFITISEMIDIFVQDHT